MPCYMPCVNDQVFSKRSRMSEDYAQLQQKCFLCSYLLITILSLQANKYSISKQNLEEIVSVDLVWMSNRYFFRYDFEMGKFHQFHPPQYLTKNKKWIIRRWYLIETG